MSNTNNRKNTKIVSHLQTYMCILIHSRFLNTLKPFKHSFSKLKHNNPPYLSFLIFQNIHYKPLILIHLYIILKNIKENGNVLK